ncbi:TRAP transporter small permease [Paralimibaculum aggregatum]|uniref:TRAP transporter small permease protein n=1 Tax=Paralimibaculum aggregatum TaxID=3036245 RepID=A0ABQ6LPA2_9RHOB|nr:TRAP transporter small permease [Limibaculum sp. NKW23]GMG82120.1 TRAP transporter small permease [Limibaculum sp. NKW23]
MKHLDRAEEYAAVLLLFVMTGLVLAQVGLRFLFGLGYGWIDELARLAFIWLVFLGAVVGMRRGLHIRVTLFIDLLPPAVRLPLTLFGELVLGAFCLVMAWHGVELVLSTLKFSFELPSTGLSMFWAYMIIPLSFGLQALRLALRMGRGDREADHVG